MTTDYYRTTDLGLTASLTASGFFIADIDKSNPRRVVFLFDDTPELQEMVNNFWSLELKLPAVVLLEHIKLLKSRIYS
jgi:hypothetical protein